MGTMFFLYYYYNSTGEVLKEDYIYILILIMLTISSVSMYIINYNSGHKDDQAKQN
jgi:hypothetical protein